MEELYDRGCCKEAVLQRESDCLGDCRPFWHVDWEAWPDDADAIIADKCRDMADWMYDEMCGEMR